MFGNVLVMELIFELVAVQQMKQQLAMMLLSCAVLERDMLRSLAASPEHRSRTF